MCCGRSTRRPPTPTTATATATADTGTTVWIVTYPPGPTGLSRVEEHTSEISARVAAGPYPTATVERQTR